MNPHKGDVLLSVGDKQFTLRYSHLALVKLENIMNKSVPDVLQELQATGGGVRIGTVVALLWAGLQKHHPRLSYEDAADLLDDIEGGAPGAMVVIGIAFEKAFATSGTKGTNPPMNGGAGIGTPSSLTSLVTDILPTSSGT